MVTSSFLKPSGPHHLFWCSGSVIAFQTSSRAKGTSRCSTSSRSFSPVVIASSLLPCHHVEVSFQSVQTGFPHLSLLLDPA